MSKNFLFSLFCFASIIFLGGCEKIVSESELPVQVTSFAECKKNGGNIAESYPRQCFWEGNSFTEKIDEVVHPYKNKIVGSEIFEIAPFTVKCQGYEPIEQDCYVVNGAYFYDPLENFRFEKGYKFKVKVDKIKIFSDEEFQQMADVSQFSYKVTEIISKEKSDETKKDYFAENENKEELNLQGYPLVCNNFGGAWLSQYRECEDLSQENCENFGGVFQACASACRHNPEAQMCIQSCVPVCSFANEDQKKLACKNNGGNWEPVGKLGLPDCIYQYSDAGKKCDSSEECQGNCIVTQTDGSNPHCANDNNSFGCKSTIEDFQKNGDIVCID